VARSLAGGAKLCGHRGTLATSLSAAGVGWERSGAVLEGGGVGQRGVTVLMVGGFGKVVALGMMALLHCGIMSRCRSDDSDH
jgi:hypothetical protein